MIKIAVMVSGSGTNLQAILDAIDEGKLDASVELVISSNKEAYGITRAQNANIQTLVFEPSDYFDSAAVDSKIVEAAQSAQCEYLVMAGYMRMVTDIILDAFPNRVVNLHPALLPSFVGAHAIADAFAAGVKVTGVTVHFANAEYDKGPIIAQRAVEVLEDDSVDTLETRIHQIEHVLYPQALQLISEGKVSVDKQTGKVRIAE